MPFATNACRFIANQLALLTLLGAVAAYFYPPLFLVFKSRLRAASATTPLKIVQLAPIA